MAKRPTEKEQEALPEDEAQEETPKPQSPEGQPEEQGPRSIVEEDGWITSYFHNPDGQLGTEEDWYMAKRQRAEPDPDDEDERVEILVNRERLEEERRIREAVNVEAMLDFRYFIRTREAPDAENPGEALALYRFKVTDRTVITERYDPDENDWVDSPDMILFIGLGGSHGYQEVTRAEAEKALAKLGKATSAQDAGQRYELPDEGRRQHEVDEARKELLEGNRNLGRNPVERAADAIIEGVQQLVASVTGRHYSPIHPGTGTSQEVHGGRGARLERLFEIGGRPEPVALDASPELKAAYDWSHEERTKVSEWARSLGYNPNLIHFVDGRGPGGKAGYFFPNTGEIILFGSASTELEHFEEGGFLQHAVGHEIQHSRFRKVQQMYQHALREVNNLPQETVDELFDLRGRPNARASAELPVYSELFDIYDSEGALALDMEGLAGLSPYSQGFWVRSALALPQHKESARISAINEDIAEYAGQVLTSKVDVNVADPSVSPYAKAYEIINRWANRPLPTARKGTGFSERHYGPGPHPGTGTEQSVHAGGRGKGKTSAKKQTGGRGARGARPTTEAREGAATFDRTDARGFKKAFDSAMKDHPYSIMVTHYSREELAQMKSLYLSEDGKVGVAVNDHGDGRIEATALFNGGGPKGAALELLRHTIENDGVNYVEAFGPRLPIYYERVGFKTIEVFSFDDDLAPEGWDFERFGRPNYHIMRVEE